LNLDGRIVECNYLCLGINGQMFSFNVTNKHDVCILGVYRILVLCNVYCVDRGLVSISIMRRLEELSKRRIHELFDYVCGVSTGALIGAMAAIYRVPIAEMEEIYKEFSVQMFDRNRLVGAGKLFTSHAYYDTELWARILRYFSVVVKLLLLLVVEFR